MKRLLVLGLFLSLLLCLLCAPVLAWSNTLNNDDIPLYLYTTGASSKAYVQYPYTDTQMVSLLPGAGNPYTILMFPNGSTSATYFAWTEHNPGAATGTWALQNSGNSLFAINNRPGGYGTGRYELVRSTTLNAKIYRDGVFLSDTATASDAAYAFGTGTALSLGTSLYIDDPTFGSAQSDTCIVGVMPHTWYILHDYLNANNYGQIDAGGNKISTTDMHVTWSIGPLNDGWVITSPPDTRYTIKISAPSGTIAYNEYINITTAGHAFGNITIPQNKTHIGNQPFEYGTYFVTLYDGASVRSTDYFRVLAASGTGSSVTWDRITYTSSDTASVDYTIDAAYYDTVTYTYKLSIKNIYGVEVASYPLSTSSGTVSVPLSGYSQGVHYGQLVITQISAPTNIGILASSAMEISAYDVFNGYVMNAENGTVISGATVNLSQSLLSDSVITNAMGAYVSTQNWLVGSATTIATTKTGFTADSLSFTPIVSKNITVNISLVPDPATTNGVSIGGVVRDKAYHNPVPDANYITQNSSLSDYHTCTTNIAGFCRNDYLTTNRLYDVWSSKTGFSNSTVTQKVAVPS